MDVCTEKGNEKKRERKSGWGVRDRERWRERDGNG